MRKETVTVWHGENVGPVDWEHETAKDMPPIWRDAESNPSAFGFDYGYRPRRIIEICMYDGWPYWKPRPAVCYVGPLGRPAWAFFDSYGVHKNSIVRIAEPETSADAMLKARANPTEISDGSN